MSLSDRIGHWLASYLSKPLSSSQPRSVSRPGQLAATLRKGDVLLVEGHSRFSVVIKYLTQSSWSHSALYVGDALGPPAEGEEPALFVEADIQEGVRAVPLSALSIYHSRICRPVGLSADEIDAVIAHATARIGHQYDLKNVFDLVRFLFPLPPVPSRYRRRMLSLGSGDPTKAICSSLIAQAFQSVHYPILPDVEMVKVDTPDGQASYRELLHIRHHSLFAPRDFDTSPYFSIVKPTIEFGFDPHAVELSWERAERRQEAKPN